MLRMIGQIILGASAFMALPAVASVDLGQTRYFKNWAAGCDNALSCQAVSLLPPEIPDDNLAMIIKRDAGIDGDLTINIYDFDTESDRYRLYIDGKLIDTGAIAQDDSISISVTGKDAMKLARAVVRGREAVLMDGNDVVLGKISLTGSAAALRFLDSAQGRVGTADAIAAKGRKRAILAKPELPIVAARKITPDDIVPPAADLVALIENSECRDERYGVTEDSAYSLGSFNGVPQALVLVSCGSGAYNFGSAAYIGNRNTNDKWTFKPALFDYRSNTTSEGAKIEILINADWDPAKQSLTSYNKGRGFGDCGQSADYVWDGEMFRLIQARVMDECRGSLDWITVWRAKVEFGV
ncbi:DUF1176 domain-containing protein [Sphingorhabdus arenilitoris]|uniref:DUF1176 domain-containing protein n=1 Tax=Sphingorhabdus arenilitoris TaxID=1490041 RepID=A0ABV8RFF8_9SPHN